MADFRDSDELTGNPYKSPLEVSEAGTDRTNKPLEIMAAWERLRLWYNAVLAGEVFVLMFTGWFSMNVMSREIGTIVAGAFWANVCFCTGHVIEYYFGLIGVRGRKVRIGIFIVGTLIAMLLALVVILHLV